MAGLFTLFYPADKPGPLSGSGCGLPGSFRCALFPLILPRKRHPYLRHILPALVFVAQSPYPDRQNIVKQPVRYAQFGINNRAAEPRGMLFS
jgi:hypothetical protein